ncbi:MAG: ATP-grasp domain-containing protein, partial [Thermoleophilia bacterium]|nr:ATP-grasp domain-containing protein [Thermoleophilia bacterium]
VLASYDGVPSSPAVLATPHVQAALTSAGCPAVVPFKTSPRFERLAETLNLRVLASPARLVRQLENKLELPRIAAAAGVAAPATRVVSLNNELVVEAIAGDVTSPAILQSATGFAGNGTELVRDADELAAAVARAPRGSIGKLAQVIAGSPVTVNGCVLGDGPDDVLVGGVTHQLTGIAECTDAPYGSCGNDWSMPLEAALLQRVREVGAAVGRTIASEGFRGVYGVDAVITNDGDVFLIELNSRITANLSLQTQLQRLTGGPTLFDAHLEAFGVPHHSSLDDLRVRFSLASASPPHPAAASIVIFHRNGEAEVAIHSQPVDPGAYRLVAGEFGGAVAAGAGVAGNGGSAGSADAGNAGSADAGDAGSADAGNPVATRLVYLRPAWRFDQLAQGECVVLPPAPQRSITPGSQLARVVTTTQVARTNASTSLTDEAAAIVIAVRALVPGAAIS